MDCNDFFCKDLKVYTPCWGGGCKKVTKYSFSSDSVHVAILFILLDSIVFHTHKKNLPLIYHLFLICLSLVCVLIFVGSTAPIGHLRNYNPGSVV